VCVCVCVCVCVLEWRKEIYFYLRFVLSALPEHMADPTVAADTEFTRKIVERSKVKYPAHAKAEDQWQ